MSGGGERPDPLGLIDSLAEKEKQLARSVILSPVVAGAKVRVRVDGIVYELSVRNAKKDDWALLRMTEPGFAEIIGQPTAAQINEYLRMFPRLRLILIDRFKENWWALAAATADTRFKLAGPVPVRLVDAGASFDTIITRFDGTSFWFESLDRKRNPKVARTLRQSLEAEWPPETVRVPEMVPQERMVYNMLFLQQHPDCRPQETGTVEGKIKAALKHANARLDAYWLRENDVITVRFVMDDGRVHTANVHGPDLTLINTGVCLRGQDANFDLTSVVGVMRQAENWDGYDDDY